MKYYRSTKLFKQDVGVFQLGNFQYLSVDSILEAQNQKADLIDISFSDYLEIREKYPVSQMDVYFLGAADCLMLFDDKYYLYQISASAFLLYISQLKINLKTNEYAVIVGNELVISQFLPALTKLGYSKFMFIAQDIDAITPFVQKIKKTFLGISVEIFNFRQISLIENLSSLLLVDVDHQAYPELMESLTYFNFLTAGSVFFDLRSMQTKDLVLEAERAQMFVLDSVQYYQERLGLADQILTKKNK